MQGDVPFIQRSAPCGVLEGYVLKPYVAHVALARAADGQQRLEHGHRDVHRVGVLAVLGIIVYAARRVVLIPLARLVEQFGGVAKEE